MFATNELHGKVIPYGSIKKVPSRNAFLDQDEYKSVDKKISKKEELLFMPNDLNEMHLQEMEYKLSKYKIVLFGVLTDGRRATVVLNGIYPFFEVALPSGDAGQATNLYNKLKTFKYACPTSFEVFKSRQFKYQKEEILFARFNFNKLKLRTEALKYVRSKNYETTNDDMSCYYRVVCRNRLTTFSSWVNISDYKIRTYNSIRGPVFSVNIRNYKKFEGDIIDYPKLAKDNIMTMCWDIETYSPDGRLPIPEIKEHKMFMIGLTFQWYHANSQLLRVCLVDHPCDPRPNYLTVVCETEKKLIKALGRFIYKMKPEINLDFNGGDYDWPWLIKRAKSYTNTLSFLAECFDATVHWKEYDDESIFSYNYKHEKVKLEADSYADGHTLVFPGYINIDVRTMFRQLYPTAEKSSLNFFLQLNSLGGKKDLPYQELFKTYRELDNLMRAQNQQITKEQYKSPTTSKLGVLKTVLKDNHICVKISLIIAEYVPSTEYSRLYDKMAEVADYCVIDSQRCHELMKKRSVIMDRREVANMSYTSVFDAFYRANGMKVRNLGIARGQQLKRRFSNISNTDMEEGKYPGAYVFPPIKGLVTTKLTLRERVQHATIIPHLAEWSTISEETLGVYYNIIREYGPCLTNEQVNDIVENKVKLHRCFIDFLLEVIGRPITGLDFSSLYPSLMMAYNLSPECIIVDKKAAKLAVESGDILHKIKFQFNSRNVRGWSVRHENKIDPNEPDCKFGLFPMLLKELFDKRKALKKILHKWEARKEEMEAMPPDEFNLKQDEYEKVCFNFNISNAKQKALKLFMNTFYGESGNKRSPFFILQLAGAITTAGQENIKMVQRYVESEGCKTYYGDSVTGDTPLVLRNSSGQVLIKTIDDLVDDEKWDSYEQFKAGQPDRIQKQQGKSALQIWSEGDWREIRRVIRHKTNKKMYRVNTHTGCIDVTEDHSLMTETREKIKPVNLRVGSKLLHSFPTEFPEVKQSEVKTYHEMVDCARCNTSKPFYEFYVKRNGNYLKPCRKCEWVANSANRTRSYMTTYFSEYEYLNGLNTVTKEEAYVWGFFMADGSCGTYECANNKFKSTWALNNHNLGYLQQALTYLVICEPNIKFKILNTMRSSGVYKLVAAGKVKLITTKYRKLFYDKRKYKLVPTAILNGSREVRQSFYDGYYVGDGCKVLEQKTKRQSFCCKGKITSQCMYYLVKSLGYKYVTVSTQEYKPNIYWFGIGTKYFTKDPIAVKKILDLPDVSQETFVYDIETSKGSFLGGVGALHAKNTDSLYIAMPEKHFCDIDKAYYTEQIDKKEYWTEMVNTTFKVIKPLNDRVNQLLIDDNGTKFLRMAYEEALYPVAFLAKKKYYGIPHISMPNFAPKKLFIRGLEVKKRGVSGLLRKVCMDIMWDSVSLGNLNTLMDLVHAKIDHIYSTDWDRSEFIKTDVFKPNKQNIKVHTFVDRMLQRGVKVKPYERFQYIVVKKNPYKYDLRGRTKKLSMGERMEFVTNTSEVIDLDYYMKGGINGQLARLITYSELFKHTPEDNSEEELKKSDIKVYANANKYIESYCAKYYSTYSSKGKIYQKIFRMSNAIIIGKIKEHCSTETAAILNSNYDVDDLLTWLENKGEKEALKSLKGYGKTYIDGKTSVLNKKEKIKKIKELQDIYFANDNNLAKMRENQFKDRRTVLQRQIKDHMDDIREVLSFHSNMISTISDKVKELLDIDKKYNEENSDVPMFEDIKEDKIDEQNLAKIAGNKLADMLENEKLVNSLNKLQFIYVNIVCNYDFIHKTRMIVDYLRVCRNKLNAIVGKPKSFDIKAFQKSAIESIVAENVGL
jgi:DNA polymerase elongation subunit (family B)